MRLLQAQQTALISCIEESERGWLQQATSPGGPVDWHAARSERSAEEHEWAALAAGSSGQATPRTASALPTPFGSPTARPAQHSTKKG